MVSGTPSPDTIQKKQANNSINRHVADSRITENALDQYRAADEKGELNTTQCSRRDQCISQSLTVDYSEAPKAAGPRQGNVLAVHLSIQAGL